MTDTSKPGRPRTADAVDKQVGVNLRRLRHAAGLSLDACCVLGGVTRQQLVKYERGENRMSPSRLLKFSYAVGLEGNVQPFFEGCGREGAAGSSRSAPSPELLALSRNYLELPKGTRDAVRALVKSLGNGRHA